MKSVEVIYKNKIFICEKQQHISRLISKSFGEYIHNKIFMLNVYEVLFLLEKNFLTVFNSNKEIMNFDTILKKTKVDFSNYLVYEDLKKKGNVPKSGFKYGCLFRVYKKGDKISKNHSKWLVEVVLSNRKLNSNFFSSKNRIANSTKKKFLIAFIDIDNSITYIENNWIKI
jgi:tRNA-intron endonuclease, archaea type